VIGNDNTEAHMIYLIDFGLAKKENSTNPMPDPLSKSKSEVVPQQYEEKENVIDPKTGKKKTATQTLKEYMADEQDNFRVVGTAMYAALAAHLPNKKYLKKDDIESLLYLLSYFGLGQLPWRYKTNQEGLEKMMHYKFEIKAKELFPPNVFPPQFGKLYEYIRFIPDDQEADYNYIERELMNAAASFKVDPSLLISLDWMNFKPQVSTPALPPSQLSPPNNRASRQQVNS
jgi:serine/threonine protein kinase